MRCVLLRGMIVNRNLVIMVRFANVNRTTTNNISSVLCNDYMCNMKRKSTLVDSVSAEPEVSAVGRKRLLTFNFSLLTVLFCLLFGGKAWGQTTLWSENFEGGSMPSGWTTDGNGSWSVATAVNSSYPSSAGQGTYCAQIKHGTTGNATKLITPTINLSSVTSAELSFMHAEQSWAGDIDGLKVYCRTSTSGTWIQLEEYTNAYASWTTEEGIALPNLSSTYQLAFEYIDNYGHGLGIDDIKIVQSSSCPKPTALSATTNVQNATITWIGSAGSYDIARSTNASASPDDCVVATGVSSNSYDFSSLSLADHYVWVRADCGGNGKSNWTAPVSFHIGYCNPAPTSIDNSGVTNVTFGTGSNVVNNNTHPVSAPYYGDYTAQIGAVEAGVQASVSITYATSYTYNTYVWVDLNNNLTFEASEVVCYGESESTNPTTLTLNFTIPANQTTGDYRMRIGGADSGLGSDPNNANPCYSSSYGIFEDYTLRVLAPPSCLQPIGLSLSASGSSVTATWIGTASAYNIDINGVVTNNVTSPYTFTGSLATTYAIRVQADCATDGTSEWTSPQSVTTDLCLIANQCEISYSLTDQYNDSWNGASIDVVDSETSEIIATITMPDVSGPYTGSFNVCNGRTLNFVWTSGSYPGECGFVFTDSNDEEIINYTIGNPPSSGTFYTYTVNCGSCPKPTGLTASNITGSSADISWTGSAESYNVRWSTLPIHNYTFDDGTMQGWTNLKVNADGGHWLNSDDNPGGYDYSVYAHSGSNFAMSYSYIDYDGAYNTNVYFISPQRYSIGANASLNFWYKFANSSYPDHMEVCVAIVDNPTASDFTSIWNSTTVDDWTEVNISLSTYVGQSIWIAFHHEDEDMYEVWVDDIAIELGYDWNYTTSNDNNITINGLSPNTTYVAQVQSDCGGDGTSNWSSTTFTTPFQISTVEEWNQFCDNVNGCTRDFYGGTVFLAANIGPVSTMAGTSSCPFRGTFEGQGYKINVGISSSEQGAAPFRYISGATIQNLKVDGTVTSNAHHASGLVGFCADGSTNTIQNCHISTNVTNNNAYNGDSGSNYMGGIVGHNKGATTSIIGCVYDGTLTSQGFKGGMIGFADPPSPYTATVYITITDSYFAGSYSANGYGDPNFSPVAVRAGHGFIFDLTSSNFYYNTDAGDFTATQYSFESNSNKDIHGTCKHAYTVTGVSPVTVAMNGTTPTTYNVSGITAYSTGIVYNGTIYGGDGDVLALSLDGSSCGYETDHGSLSGSGNPYSLTMEAYNTVISAPVYTVTVNAGEGGTASGSGTYNCGENATLTATPSSGYYFYQWNDGNTDNPRTINNITSNVTYTATFKQAPLIINNTTDWNNFAEAVSRGYNYSSKTVTLTNDITVNTIIPGSPWATSSGFHGTFDGQCHTITINNYTTSDEFVGLFRYTYGATIKNLIVDGTINSSNIRAGGLIGLAQSTTTFTNCRSNVTINSTHSGSAENGGFVGAAVNKITFEGCAFSGSLNGANATQNGGFVGKYYYESNYSHTYTNCLFVPLSMNIGITNSSTFAPTTYNTFTNCYYTEALGTQQGSQVYSVTGDGVGVSIQGSASTSYSCSGLDFYSPGLTFNGTIYGASGNELAISLTHDAPSTGYELTYTATNGTLSDGPSVNDGSDDYTLTKEAGNTVISATFTPINYTVTAVVYPTEGGSATGAGIYAYNTSCTLEATANTGYQFVNWTDSEGSVVTANTSYTFTVTGNVTYQANFTKTTVTSLPWTENFNGYSCASGTWEYLHGEWATPLRWTKAACVANYSPAATSGSYSLEMRANNSTNLVVLPQFDEPLNKLKITFQIGRGNTASGYTVQLGYVTNPSDASTFTALNTINTPSSPVASHTRYTYDLTTNNNAPSSSEYRLAIKYTTTNMEDSWYLDDFDVRRVYTIAVSDNPGSASSSLSGAGKYDHGATCTVNATASGCYNFVNWTENGTEVSTSASYSFTATADRNLVANFEEWTLSIDNTPSSLECINSGTEVVLTATATAVASTTYSWDASSGSTTGTDSDNTYTVSPIALSNTYTVSATVGGCERTQTATITTKPVITSEPSSSEGNEFCLGVSTNLSVESNAPSFTWDNGAGSGASVTVTPTATTTYTVSATSGSCVSTGSITITVNTPDITDYDYIWRGVSTDWNTSSNWYMYSGGTYSVASGDMPTAAKNYYIGTGDCLPGSSWPSLSADATIGDVTIDGGGSVTVPNGKTLSIAGSISGSITAESGSTIEFVGSSDQTISGSQTFSNVKFSKGGANVITATNGLAVNGTATFTSGIVSGNVTFGEDGSSAGANLNSYVDGTVIKNGNGSSFTFPTGSDGVLGTITATIADGESATAKFNHKIDGEGHGFSIEDGYPRWWNVADMCGRDPFNHVSNFEYWDFNSTADLSGVTFVSKASSADAHFHNPSEYPADDSDIIQIAVYDGCWKNIGGHLEMSDENKTITISGVNASRGTTRSGSAITTFGSKDPSVVLPIELTSFTATCDGRSALVEWTTATERNNDYFSLERSDDAINFVEIVRVAGTGNSIESIDYAYTDYGIHGGDNYYRLVQVDYDGTRTVSEVIVANCIEPESDGEPEVLAYPNPFSSELTVVLDNFGNRAATIEVYDMLGKLIYTNKVAAPQNSYETILNLSNLPPAAYTVRVSTNDFVINRNVVKQ